MQPKFNYQCILTGSLCMKFHDDKCKEKAVMRRNHFINPTLLFLIVNAL